MLQFRPLTLDDYAVVCEYLAYEKTAICDTMPGTVFMWREYFHTEFCTEGDVLFFRVTYPDGVRAYAVPVPPGDLGAAFARLQAHGQATGEALVLSPVSKDQLALVAQYCAVREAVPVRDWFDYVYEIDRMKTFPGKKLHGQRNFLNRFNALCPQAEVTAMTPEHLDLCRDFLQEYEAQALSLGAARELTYTKDVLDHYEQYGLLGTCVLVDGRVVAFAIGSVRGKMLYEHIEKATRQIPGAYQKIASAFATMYGGDGIAWVNREDDMGNLSLRTSKLAYQPVELLEKYIVYCS